jgi:hypothetical protein
MTVCGLGAALGKSRVTPHVNPDATTELDEKISQSIVNPLTSVCASCSSFKRMPFVPCKRQDKRNQEEVELKRPGQWKFEKVPIEEILSGKKQRTASPSIWVAAVGETRFTDCSVAISCHIERNYSVDDVSLRSRPLDRAHHGLGFVDALFEFLFWNRIGHNAATSLDMPLFAAHQ